VNFKTLSPLQLALGASLLVHGVLLTVRLVDPETFNRVFEDTPLEVVLVNARTQDKPTKAQALAQTSMAGGGEAEAGRATSPLPSSLRQQPGEDAEEATYRQLQTLQEQQTLLLSQVKKQLAALPQPTPQQTLVSADAKAQAEKRRLLSKLLAEIEERIREENARPKKRYISPATREAVYALYYDNLRRRIESRGTRNFPESGGRKLYGELTMVITVNADGRVLKTEIAKSSGNPALDQRAEAIAGSAGPFGRFSEAMQRKADQILVVSRFRFTRDETLETSLTSQ
jgi:protein TonB